MGPGFKNRDLLSAFHPALRGPVLPAVMVPEPPDKGAILSHNAMDRMAARHETP